MASTETTVRLPAADTVRVIAGPQEVGARVTFTAPSVALHIFDEDSDRLATALRDAADAIGGQQ